LNCLLRNVMQSFALAAGALYVSRCELPRLLTIVLELLCKAIKNVAFVL
jgi:hypothetical protein